MASIDESVPVDIVNDEALPLTSTLSLPTFFVHSLRMPPENMATQRAHGIEHWAAGMSRLQQE
ncbi:MAG: hypothetical protein Q9160_009274, partial [Pyrenula sp. 1 TL-2023]